MTAQPFPVTFANLPGGNNPAADLDQNFAVCVRGPTPTVMGVVPYWDNTGGTSLNAGLPTNPGFGTITTLVGLDSLSRLPAVSGALLTGIPSGLIRSYLAGMTLSNDGVTPNTILDISAGVAADSTNAVMINSPTAFTKTTGGGWTSGTGNAGMGLGLTIAINTWYHVLAINNGGNPDFYFDTSAAGANKPVGTTAFRRIGSFKTAAASTNILTFIQDGDLFQWNATPIQDAITAGNLGTAAIIQLLASVPTGVNVLANFEFVLANSGAASGCTVYCSDLATADVAAAQSGTFIGDVANVINAGGGVSLWQGRLQIRTNTSGQIRVRLSSSNANITYAINTLGWIDSRGRNN